MNTQGSSLLFVTENGMGKRTNIDEFHIQHRGGKGLKCYKVTEKTGYLVGVKAVNDDHEIMMITTEGIIIQLRCDEISTYGRITSGVKLINLKNGVTVARIAKVRQTNATSDETAIEEGNGEVVETADNNIDDIVELAEADAAEEAAESADNEESDE